MLISVLSCPPNTSYYVEQNVDVVCCRCESNSNCLHGAHVFFSSLLVFYITWNKIRWKFVFTRIVQRQCYVISERECGTLFAWRASCLSNKFYCIYKYTYMMLVEHHIMLAGSHDKRAATIVCICHEQFTHSLFIAQFALKKNQTVRCNHSAIATNWLCHRGAHTQCVRATGLPIHIDIAHIIIFHANSRDAIEMFYWIGASSSVSEVVLVRKHRTLSESDLIEYFLMFIFDFVSSSLSQ